MPYSPRRDPSASRVGTIEWFSSPRSGYMRRPDLDSANINEFLAFQLHVNRELLAHPMIRQGTLLTAPTPQVGTQQAVLMQMLLLGQSLLLMRQQLFLRYLMKPLPEPIVHFESYRLQHEARERVGLEKMQHEMPRDSLCDYDDHHEFMYNLLEALGFSQSQVCLDQAWPITRSLCDLFDAVALHSRDDAALGGRFALENCFGCGFWESTRYWLSPAMTLRQVHAFSMYVDWQVDIAKREAEQAQQVLERVYFEEDFRESVFMSSGMDALDMLKVFVDDWLVQSTRLQ